MKKLINKIEILSNKDLFELIDTNTEIVILAPWNGKPIPVTIRMLDSVSLTSCGEFNTVSNIIEDEEKTPEIEDILKVKNIHENMLRLSMVCPTFKEMQNHMEGRDFHTNIQKEIKEIKELIDSLESQNDKEMHNKYLTRLELSISFLFPEDFTAYIITILLQREATDLNKLTRNTLLQCGFLGERYNTRPSEYIEGTFTDKQRVDIDVTALTLVADYREQEAIKGKSGMKWIRGGKK